jgi:hypothetical protein
MFGIRQLCVARLNRLSIYLVRPSGIVSEHRDGLCDVLVHGLLVRFAIIPSIYSSENVAVLLAEITELPKQLTAFGGRDTTP